MYSTNYHKFIKLISFHISNFAIPQLGLHGLPACENNECPFRCVPATTQNHHTDPLRPSAPLLPIQLTEYPLRLRVCTSPKFQCVTASTNAHVPIKITVTPTQMTASIGLPN